MERETFGKVLANRLSRMVLACAGLMLFAFGGYLQLQANIGLASWSSLNQGLALRFPISYGTASILVSVAVIVVDLLMKEPIGLGTILDAFLVGWGTDLFLRMGFPMLEDTMALQLLLLFLGMVILCMGQYLYMRAGLSCGPRDALMVGLGKRFPKLSIGAMNIIITVVVLLCAMALGSRVGVGTVVCIFGSGAVMDAVFKLLRFEPRSVEHEGLMQTFRALISAIGDKRE